MSISHLGGHRPLPLVPPQQSPGKSQTTPADLDIQSLPATRKTLPDPAKGAANGLSVQKVFARWDTDGDGKITSAEAGRRFGHGLLAALLKLQEATPAAAAVPPSNPPAAGAGEGGLIPPESETATAPTA